MFYLACIGGVIWFAGVLFLVSRLMNSLRLTLNNLAPGANYWAPEYKPLRKGYPLSYIDPALFNETGRIHFKRLTLYGTTFSAWLLLGFILLVSFSYYFAAL
jgi:hypothetical protein